MKTSYYRLDEVAGVVSGSTPRTSKKEYYSGDILWATPRDLSRLEDIYIDDTEKKITAEGYESCSTTMLPAGSVLFSSRAPIGLIAITKQDICTNQGFKSFVCDKNKICSEYLYYCLQFYRPMIQKLGRGATFTEISKNLISSFKIPVPNIKDQEKIANILIRTELLIKKRLQAIILLEEFQKSFYLSIFGDPAENPKNIEIDSIQNICDVQTGSTPSRKNKNYFNGDISWVKTTEVKGNRIFETKESITYDALENSNCKVFPEKTILIAMYGQGKTRGNVGLMEIEGATNQACAAILPGFAIQPNFLFWQFKMRYQEIRNLGRGGNQPNLNLSMVKNLKVLIPPIDQQIKFEEVIENVEKLKIKQKESEIELNNLFKCLLQKAFKGELV